jgi:hypothetical protein
VPEELCAHCGDSHPARTAFCPVTGKAMAAEPAGPTPIGMGQTEPGGEPAAAPEQGVFDLLQQAFQLYRKHAKAFITVAAVVFVPGAVAHACARAAILAPTVAVNVALDPVTHLPLEAPAAMGVLAAGFATMMLGLLAAAVTGLFLHGVIIPLTQGALALAAADRLLGRETSWQDLWTLLFRRVGTVFSAIVPAALLTGIGFFFLVVPGALLAFFFSFVPTVALFEGVGGVAALRRSYELVRADWLRMLLVLITFALLSGLAQIVAGMFFHGVLGTRLLQDALTLIVLPVPVIGSVLLYFDIRRKHEGYDHQQLAAELERLRTGA